MPKRVTLLTILLILMATGSSANAGAVQKSIDETLNAKRIIEVIPSRKINKGLLSPIVVRYVKEGDFVPSCGLLHTGKYIDMVSPEPGGTLPSCGVLREPIYFEQDGTYAVYEYGIEDPRGELTIAFHLYKLGELDMKACQNDEQLTQFAIGSLKIKGVKKSFSDSLLKLGCM